MTYEKSHKEINGVLHKLCNKCNEWFPCTEEYFYKNNNNKTDGLHPYCKECGRKKAHQWREENYEQSLDYKRKWHKTEHAKELTKEYLKYWREENKEHKQEYQLKWQQENKNKLSRYNEKRQNKNHNINKKEWGRCKEYFNNSCAYCRVSEEEHRKVFKQDLHKEHVNHNGTNDLSNCVPSCKSCNSQKWEFTLEEWYNEDKPIFTQERLNKIHKWLNEDYKLERRILR